MVPIKPPKFSRTAQSATTDGFIVVAVLWMLGALSLLASIYAVYVINTAASFASYDEQLRAEALVSAALELTAYRQLTQPPQSRLTSGQFSFHLGRADVAVEFQSEAARIDLNAAPKQLLAGLFRTLGASSQNSDTYADRVVSWRTAVAKDQDSEGSAYRTAGLGYQPRAAKFPHTNELSLVRDLPASLVERALPFITVYSGRPQINVLDAAPEVIAALPGMTSEHLRAYLGQRRVAPENAKTLLPKEAQQYATFDGGKTFRITVNTVFDNGHRQSAQAVILLFDAGDQPFAVLSRHDGFNPMITDNQP